MSAPPPVVPSAADAAEQRMRGLLAQEKWREARNDLKTLVKSDRARFLPLLIESNLGLARTMLASGQEAQARQVMAYLATLVPADQMPSLEARLTMDAGPAGPSPAAGIAALADATVERSEPDRRQLADHVVLAFEPVNAAGPAEARLAGEAGAIHAALQSMARRDWAAVTETLAQVPHRSPFSHWAIFVKGLMAFHTGGEERAAKLLQNLPEGSAPAKAAQAYLHLLAKPPAPAGGEPLKEPPPEAVVAAICRLVGAGELARVLNRAERQWRSGNHVESYRAVRDGLTSFPSAGLDWPGLLGEFYFKAPFGMPRAHAVRFLDFFAGLIERRRVKNDAEAMFAHRLLVLMGQAAAPPGDLRAEWEAFLRARRAIRGMNPRLESLAYGWLGTQMAAMQRSRGFFAGPPVMRNPEGAVKMFLRSIELDPGNLAPHLALIEVYATLKKRTEQNRLLDQMTVRFPDDKQVLVRAAEGCLERKAFGKGLDYLTRARQLDQLDPRIPELTVAGLCNQARQYFQQRRPEKARHALAQAEAWLTDQPADFRRGRWTWLARHGVMERTWGDAAQGKGLLARARELAPNPATLLLFAHLASKECAGSSFRGETDFLKELKKVLRVAPRLAEIGLWLRLLDQWRTEDDEIEVRFEEELIAGVISLALSQPFTRAEAAEVMERARDNPEFERALRQLVKKLLVADPRDPQARIWQLELNDPWVHTPEQNRGEIQSVIEEASRRRDEPSLRRAREMLGDLDQPPFPRNPFGPDFAGPEFEEDDDDDFAPGGGPLPPEMLEEFGELLEAMRVAPESALRELRQTAKLNGMPDFVLDQLIAAAKGKPLPPNFPPPPLPKVGSPPSAPKPAPAPLKPPKFDFNQRELF